MKNNFNCNAVNILTTSKKEAFTLAEVLITLGVIGIVAAMTIPTLINNYQEKVTVTKVKKMYSLLYQAVKLAEVDNGSVNTWSLPLATDGGSQTFYNYIKPYLKVTKECLEDNSADCIDANLTYYYLNGNKWDSPNVDYIDERYVRIILADGSLIWLRTNFDKSGCNGNNNSLSNVCVEFWYDVNGSTPPNTIGRDIFSWFLAMKNNESIFSDNTDDCYKDNMGWSCIKWILEHDNMDYPATTPAE